MQASRRRPSLELNRLKYIDEVESSNSRFKSYISGVGINAGRTKGLFSAANNVGGDGKCDRNYETVNP